MVVVVLLLLLLLAVVGVVVVVVPNTPDLIVGPTASCHCLGCEGLGVGGLVTSCSSS